MLREEEDVDVGALNNGSRISIDKQGCELTPYCPSFPFPPVREGDEEGYFYPPPGGGGIYKWSISYWESLEPMFFPTGLYEEKSTVEIFDEKNLRNASPYVEEPTAFAVAPMLDPMHGVFWKGSK